jgi:nitrate/nitrite transporter NarK
MMALPLSTIFTEPLGGNLADHHEPRLVASAGIFFSLLAVVLYSRLGLTSSVLLVIPPLMLIGLGGALLRPSNQVAVYATVEREQYGSLSAVITALGALAGSLGSTVTVALHESRASGADAAAFVHGQQFTFAVLIPIVAVSAALSLLGRSRPEQQEQHPEISAAPASEALADAARDG